MIEILGLMVFFSISVMKLSKYLEGVVNNDFMVKFKEGVRFYNDDFLRKNAGLFYVIFEKVYGGKQFSKRCLVVSLVVSFFYCGTLIFISMMHFIGYERFLYYVFEHPLFLYDLFFGTVVDTFVMIFCINFVADFLSVWISRKVFYISCFVNGGSDLIFLFFVDVIISFLFFWVCFFPGLALIDVYVEGGYNSNWEIPEGISFFGNNESSYRLSVFLILFSSTFFSSAFFGGYFLSVILLKLNLNGFTVFNFVNKIMDFDSKPIQSFGIYVVALLWVLFLLVCFFVWGVLFFI